MRPVAYLAAAIGLALGLSGPASGAELFGGIHVHDVKTPLTLSGIERGFDISAGFRGGRIGKTPLQPYGFIAVHSRGDTSYGAVGLSAKFGDKVYVRPGVGLAVHTGSTADHELMRDKIAFGSRILFEPELAVGTRINQRLSIEASWIHMSHGTLLSRQNPGIDNIGMRVNLAL